MKNIFNDLFIFEMANNHQGDVEHGIAIIEAMANIARKSNIKAAVKLQYRQLDTFIHPAYRNDKNAKHIGRFLSTELKKEQFKKLLDKIKEEGMLTMVTPFDEESVDVIEEHNVDIIKIASCSAEDWPLLSKITETDKPIIASTGGVELGKIDNLVSFLSNRKKEFAIMHCVGIYPTPDDKLNLRLIERLKKRYPKVPIGYSGHEAPENYLAVQVATSFGAELYERHVGVPTDTIKLNAYSMNPKQVSKWVDAQKSAKIVAGQCEKIIMPEEQESLLTLKRGVFVNKKIQKGQAITSNDVFFAMPCQEKQLTSGEFGRVRARYFATKNYEANDAVYESSEIDNYYKIRQIIHEAKGIIAESGIVLNNSVEVEISHHYGLERFYKFGCIILNLVNREYCKKIIMVFAGQHHPEQKHLKKEETFHVLQGVLVITLNGISKTLEKGDIVTIERGVVHSFYSEKGAIFEEISSTHYRNDSYYTDTLISEQDPMSRKTILKNF